MWRAIVAVWHSGDEICPPEGEGSNLVLGQSKSKKPPHSMSGHTLPWANDSRRVFVLLPRSEAPPRSCMTLSSTDFFQRWLRHVPAPQSRVVRFYGLYHHTHAEALVHCRAQVGQLPVVVPVARDWQTACAQRGEAHPERCPAGGQRLVCMGAIPRGGAPPPPGWATCSMTRYGRQTRARHVPGACRLGAPRGLGGTRRTLSMPGTRATPVRGGGQDLSQAQGRGVTRHNLHSACRGTPYQATSLCGQSNPEFSYT